MSSRREVMQKRARIVRAVRQYFDELDFVEVDTPVAISAPAPEAHIEAPEIFLRTAEGPARRFLQPSPELAMKRLLSCGLERIFQIAPVFRDGDDGAQHRPEFRLLEWYRAGAGWTALLPDCEGLLRACAEAAGRGVRFRYRDREVDLQRAVRVTMEEAFLEHAGLSILDTVGEQPDAEALRGQARRLGVPTAADDTWGDLFHRIFLTHVEPAICCGPHPVFLTHYPAPLASLARLSPDDPRTAERVELYVAGLELANGFGELADPQEQRRRFVLEREERRRAGRRDYPLDEYFLAALSAMPEAAGIALGVERLLMLLLDAGHIDEVAFVPWSQS